MKRPNLSSVATAIAVSALFVALGGPAQAASLITGVSVKNGSLTGKDVRNSSLSGADIRNSSLAGRDIRNRSLTGADIRSGSLTRSAFAAGQLATGATGATGPAGPVGARGATGPVGLAGPSRWALVNAAGQIEQQSGGFRIANAYPTTGGGAANGNVYIESGDADLTNNGIVATLALQNQTDQNGDAITNGSSPNPDANPEFSGEITVSQCALASIVACAPMDVNTGGAAVPTNAKNYFVVSPRLSDGRRTSDANSPVPNATPNRKRFYVIISGPRD